MTSGGYRAGWGLSLSPTQPCSADDTLFIATAISLAGVTGSDTPVMPMAAAKRFCFGGEAAGSQSEGYRAMHGGIEQHGTRLAVPVDHRLAWKLVAIAVARREQRIVGVNGLDKIW